MSIRSSGGIVHDSVSRALDGGITETPQLVVTGIDVGPNLGALADQVSGTVGAARAVVARCTRALATSMGLSDGVDYVPASTYVVAWIDEHSDALLGSDMADDITAFDNAFVTLSDLPPLVAAARGGRSSGTRF